MQAEIFYSYNQYNSKTIYLLTKDEYKNNSSLNTRTKAILNAQKFQGESGEIAIIMDESGLLESIYVGLGEQHDSRAIAQIVTKIPAGHYAFDKSISEEALIIWSRAQYKFLKFKESKCEPRVLLVSEKDYKSVTNIARSIFLVRDLINLPTNVMGPKELSETVKQLSKDHDAKFKEWVGQELIDNNFPAIHAVGRASESEPRLLSLTWGNPNHPKISLVGKGVCFDSGGLDIKPANGMRIMKKDMGGAANVIGLAKWIMMEELPVYLKVFIPAVENSISNNAYRPGDVLTMRNGMTVEIDNTDAEGRLVLADAMVLACEDNPELLIDFATLTGAARIAVGTEISAMFSNDDKLATDILKAAEQTRDPICRMPLFADYKSLLESTVADMTNSAASSYGGAITAALFLDNYISNDVKWAHFDIMAWNLSSSPGKPAGGEAMGIIAVANYLNHKYATN
ncbi:MAG: leucyl aminopeptidase family protein [Legionellaceae bacterium]|nr:leucyl aminopeptidase family protein [Legionellaceae bacterium]